MPVRCACTAPFYKNIGASRERVSRAFLRALSCTLASLCSALARSPPHKMTFASHLLIPIRASAGRSRSETASLARSVNRTGIAATSVRIRIIGAAGAISVPAYALNFLLSYSRDCPESCKCHARQTIVRARARSSCEINGEEVRSAVIGVRDGDTYTRGSIARLARSTKLTDCLRLASRESREGQWNGRDVISM